MMQNVNKHYSCCLKSWFNDISIDTHLRFTQLTFQMVEKQDSVAMNAAVSMDCLEDLQKSLAIYTRWNSALIEAEIITSCRCYWKQFVNAGGRCKKLQGIRRMPPGAVMRFNHIKTFFHAQYTRNRHVAAFLIAKGHCKRIQRELILCVGHGQDVLNNSLHLDSN